MREPRHIDVKEPPPNGKLERYDRAIKADGIRPDILLNLNNRA